MSDSPALHIRLLQIKGTLSSGLGWLVLGLLALLPIGIVGFFGMMIVGQGIGLWRMAAWHGETTGIVESITVVHGRKRTSSAKITYTYEAGGRLHTGSRVGPEWEFGGIMETGGASVANGFEKGQRITVHFNPDHPEQAFLWPKIRGLLLGFPCALLLLILPFLRGWNWQRTARRKTIPACALIGLGAGGVALLFGAPVYVEPWIAGALLGGGLAGGVVFGWWKGVPTRDNLQVESPVYKKRKA